MRGQTARSLANRLGGAVAIATALYVLAHLAWLVFGWGGDARRLLVADAFVLPGFLAAYWAARRAARHPLLDPRVARAWEWLGGAYALLWSANVASTWRHLVPDAPEALDALAGALVRVSYLPLLAGLLRLPSAPRTRADRTRFALDLATTVLGAGLVVWYLVIRPAALDPHAGQLDVLVDLAPPVFDIAVVAVIAGLLLGRLDAGSRQALRLLAGGQLLSVAAGVVTAVLGRATGPLAPGHWVDALWLLSAALLVLAADVQYRHAAAGTAGAPRVAREGGFSLLPYLGLALGSALLLALSRPWWGRPLGVVIVGGVALSALVAVRQVLALRDNRRLVAERLAQAASLRESRRARDTLLRNLPGMAYRCRNSPEWPLEFVSGGCIDLTGYSADDLTARPGRAARVRYADVIDPDDRERVWAGVQAAMAERRPFQFHYRITTADGRTRHVYEQGRGVFDDRGTLEALEGFVMDVTERTIAEARLEHQAFHDALTGLANRSLFRDRVGHALARGRRLGTRPAVLFLDLDEFKAVNDGLGHAEGDRLLVEVSTRLLGATRGCDTVARLGGDEFAVLLSDVYDEGEATAVAERVLRALAKPITLSARDVLVGASVGIAAAVPGEGADELLRNADLAMYHAKARGKGTYEVFAPAMYEVVSDRVALLADLRGALDRKEFAVVYQPVVDLGTGHVVGAEALIRWTHPARGPVPPPRFIGLAEDSGLILPIGRFVLEAACRQAAGWLRDGHGDLHVAVNMSGRQLQYPGFVADVAAVLAATGLPPHALLLEITESVVMQDTEASLARLAALKALGVRLAIDDFGTGYSSLAYLQRFPVDVLKIDKRFVDGVHEGRSGEALARTIVALGETLGLRTVGEGIERPEQRDALRSLGCTYGQGYLFARPLPAHELDGLLAVLAQAPPRHAASTPAAPTPATPTPATPAAACAV